MKNKKKYFVVLTILLIIFVVVVSVVKNNNNSKTDQNIINRDSKLSDIKLMDDKVNIYFFYGNGCPHCEDEFVFLENLSEEYSKDINIYSLEVLYNQDNADILIDFAEIMGKQVTGVPFTIIGEETFSGFGKSAEDSFKNAIKKQINNSFDVYNEYQKS